MIVLHFAVFWSARHEVLSGAADFSIFYTAGLILQHGQGGLVYSNGIQRQTQHEFASAFIQDNGFLPYNHPPFEALVFFPLTYMPYIDAYFLWLGINLLVLTGSIYLIRPWTGMLHSTFPWMVYLAALGFFPTAYALLQGQDSILLLALYCLAYAEFRRRRDTRAGIYLGLGLFKFHLILPFAFILLLRRRWKVLLGICLSACFELVISWAIVGKELFYYPRYAWLINRHVPMGVIFPENMPNLRGLLMGWMQSATPPLWIDAVLIATSAGLLVWASRYWQAQDFVDNYRWNAGFSIALVVTFLVGYHSYNHDMSILLLPILLTWNDLLDKNPSARSAALKVVLGVMFLSPLYMILTLQYFHQNLFALVLLSLAGLLASFAATKRPTLASKDTPLSTAQLR
jgi:hypothetical protein